MTLKAKLRALFYIITILTLFIAGAIVGTAIVEWLELERIFG
jgi:uncharacterized membrane protein YoaK (UPF0700 family)